MARIHTVPHNAAALPCSHYILSNEAVIQESYKMDFIAERRVIYVLSNGESKNLEAPL